MLNSNTIELIRNDADLYAKVAKKIKKAPTYLATLLRKKDKQLTQMDVLQTISEHTGIKIDDLIEKENAEESITATK